LYKTEKEMYPDVCAWLKKALEKKFKNAEIRVEDTSKKVLSKWLVERGFHRFFPDYQTYEIEVDVTGIALNSTRASLALVECKFGRITLRDLSQLLGYSKVALPLHSVILSPKGISRSMHLLLSIARRNDVLYYSTDRHIIIAKWNERRREPDLSSIIPKGSQTF
jgi:hypothetical protein